MSRRAPVGAWVLAAGAALLLGAWVATLGHDPVRDVAPALRHAAPGAGALLGRDGLGRPVGLRLAAATHAVLLPGLGAALLCGLLGVPLGLAGGWWGGLAARGLGLLRDSLSALPDLVLALLLVLVLGDGALALVLGVALAGVPGLAGAVADRVARLRHADFVEASLLHGVPTHRIILRHLLWGACRGLVLRQALVVFGAFVVLETSLAYLGGVGTQEPLPSWGNMLASLGPDPRAPAVARLAPVAALWAVLALVGAALRRVPDPGAGA